MSVILPHFVPTIRTGDSCCPIVPVVIGEENKSSQFARHLLSEGVLAVSLAFPVVPKGQG